jgi:hypothetical protein
MEERDKVISIEAHHSPRWVLKGIKRLAAERKQQLGQKLRLSGLHVLSLSGDDSYQPLSEFKHM